MFLAGRRTHNNRAFFHGFEGVFMGLIMGSQNIMGSDYESNILVKVNTCFLFFRFRESRMI